MVKIKSRIAGYDLYKHHKALAQHKGAYIPPHFYDAMKAVPPPKLGYRPGYNPGKIVFPDDDLRRKIENKTKGGEEIARYAPWWFTSRPIDDAVKRIHEIMKEKKISESEALKEWDKEYERIQRINKREVEMLNQDAQKEGKYLTALDAFKMVKKMRQLQLESQSFREFRLSTANDEDGKEKLELIKKLREEKKPKIIPQYIINDSLKRKLIQVKEIRDVVKRINHLQRVLYGVNSDILEQSNNTQDIDLPNIEFSELDMKDEEEVRGIDEPTEIHFIDAFVAAYGVNRVSPTSPEWGKNRFNKGSTNDDDDDVDDNDDDDEHKDSKQFASEKIEESLQTLHETFRITFDRFCKLVYVEVDIGKYLSSIDLNLEENSFSKSNLYKYTKEKFFDISPLCSKYENASRFEILLGEKENLKQLLILNEMLYHVEKEGFLRTETINWKEINEHDEEKEIFHNEMVRLQQEREEEEE